MKFHSKVTTLILLTSSRAASAFTHVKAASNACIASTHRTMTATATTVENPLMDQAGLPKFASIEPKHLTPAVDSLLHKLETDFAALEESLVQNEKETAIEYPQVIPELEKMQEPLGYAWGVAGHLNGVKNGDELREAYEEAQPKVVKAFSKFSQSKPLYDALESIQDSLPDDAESFLDQQKARAVEKSLLQMKLGGVGLEGDAKERFNEIKVRLSELSLKFSNNVLDSTKAFGLVIEDADTVKGVPDSALGMWAQMYAQGASTDDDKVEPNAEAGPWKITLDGPSYLAAMQHIPDRATREAIYMAYLTKASDIEKDADGARNNVPLIDEILSLRAEAASMLGFTNHAEKSLAAKMAPSVASVEELSDLILEKALPAAYKELESITAYARENGGEDYSEANLEKLMPWDTTFWSERYKEAKFELKEEELRPYFQFEKVLDGLFGLVKRIFGITIKAADGQAEVWNDDVRFFTVHDEETDEHIASFYLDPYSRPADKRGGAWMDVCIGKSDACDRDVPVAYLTCNGSPPVGDTPSLMTFREVETLFHEAGHGFQHMLTKASVGDVAGINGVEWDAVELPSQFMENWCYDKATVYGFAKHYETGEPLPEEFFEKLCAQKTYNAGMMSCRQLTFGMLDIELHSNYDPASDETVFDVQKRMSEKYSPYQLPLAEDRFLCAFSHIFAGGYSAGYYSYKWAEVMSADAFGAFEDAGLDNEEEVKKVGRSFRDTVLSLGGGVHPSDVFRQFRGRDPTPDALLRHNGLA